LSLPRKLFLKEMSGDGKKYNYPLPFSLA